MQWHVDAQEAEMNGEIEEAIALYTRAMMELKALYPKCSGM